MSYFTFLKWLLQLNVYIFILTLCFVIIPQAISTGKELPLNQTPQNASNTTINSSSSSAIVPTSATASPVVRRRRDVTPNATEGEESDRICHLVKPHNYSLYTNKPVAQLLTDFFSGIVSWHIYIQCIVQYVHSAVCTDSTQKLVCSLTCFQYRKGDLPVFSQIKRRVKSVFFALP